MLQSNKNKTYRGRFDHLSVSIAMVNGVHGIPVTTEVLCDVDLKLAQSPVISSSVGEQYASVFGRPV